MGQLSDLHSKLLRLKLDARALLTETEASVRETQIARGAAESRALAEATENLWRTLDALYGKANFNPNQPRVPRGNPDGGQWTDDPAHAGARALSEEGLDAGRSRQVPDTERNVGPEHLLMLAGGGHHYMPVSLFKKLPFRPEARRVFDKATPGPLIDGHGNSKEHFIYNQLMAERVVDYSTRKGIRIEDWTAAHAAEFVEEIKNPPDEIGRFNRKIRRLQAILRFMQRRMR